MPKQSKFIIAGSVLMLVLGIAAFYLNTANQAEGGTNPASVQAPVPETTTPEGAAKTEAGMPPLLLMLISIVVVATAARIGQLVVRKKFLQPVPGNAVAQLRKIALEINSWTRHSDPALLEQLNRDARRIGEELYRQGGWTLMVRAYHQAGSPKAVKKAWEGIGTWEG
jgi:hypothetical protein